MCTCLDDWSAYHRARGHAANTIRMRIGTVRRCALSAGKEPCALTTTDMIEFLDRPLAAWTRSCYVTSLQHWVRWLERTGRRPTGEGVDLPKPRNPRTLPRPIPEAAIPQILAACDTRERAMILLAAYAGLRVHEIAKFRGEDIAPGALYVEGKGGVRAMVPAHPLVAQVADLMPSRGYWFPSSIAGESMRPRTVGKLMTYAMRRAGVPGSPHQLRHRYGTAVLRASGGNLRVAQELLRHSSPTTTAIYTLVEDDEKRCAVMALT